MSQTTVQDLLRKAARMLERCPPESTTLFPGWDFDNDDNASAEYIERREGLRQAARAIEATGIDMDSGTRVANRHLGYLVQYIADMLETTGIEAEQVDPLQACPKCGERDMDRLVWLSDALVRCATCRKTYSPPR